MSGEWEHVFRPVAKRRHFDLDDIEPEEEIFCETSGGQVGFERSPRRRHDSHVRRSRPCLAESLEPPFPE